MDSFVSAINIDERAEYIEVDLSIQTDDIPPAEIDAVPQINAPKPRDKSDFETSRSQKIPTPELMKLTRLLLTTEVPFSLNLANLDLEDPVIEAIEPLIVSQKCAMRELILTRNSKLSLNFIKKLAAAIEQNQTLRSLNLSKTAADCEGKQLIINAVIIQGKMKELDLGPIPEPMVDYLTKRIENMTFLRHLAFEEGELISSRKSNIFRHQGKFPGCSQAYFRWKHLPILH